MCVLNKAHVSTKPVVSTKPGLGVGSMWSLDYTSRLMTYTFFRVSKFMAMGSQAPSKVPKKRGLVSPQGAGLGRVADRGASDSPWRRRRRRQPRTCSASCCGFIQAVL